MMELFININKGNKLKLKDNYKFDGTSIVDSDGKSAIADLGDIRINVRGGLTVPDSDKTFKVDKTASTTSNYYIDGTSDPTLILARGKTTPLKCRSGHPFYLKSTSSTSGTSDEYTSGVVRKGSINSSNDGDSLVFTVPLNAPNTLWYQCSSHSGMLGQLTIKDDNKADDTVITVSTLANSFLIQEALLEESHCESNNINIGCS